MPNRPEILMTPGPTPVPPAVLAAQAEPLVYHRGPGYGALLTEVIEGIRWLTNASGDVAVYTSSGTGGTQVCNKFVSKKKKKETKILLKWLKTYIMLNVSDFLNA